MNILITNDDGYEAEGIKVLAEELSKNHNVYVLAPSSNRSAVSNCVSIREMLELKKINDKLWTLSGFPADCVITAMRSGIFEGIEFDVVLSGINKGPNLGTDIVYSGTCAGARQAVFYKIPGIAVSVDAVDYQYSEDASFSYKPLAAFVTKNINQLIKIVKDSDYKVFVNVNAPSVNDIKDFKGVKYCTALSIKDYGDSIELFENGKDTYKTKYRFGKNIAIWDCDCPDNVDINAHKKGYISISSVFVEPNCIASSETVDCNAFSL